MTASYTAMTSTFAMRITERMALLLMLEIFIVYSKMAKGKIPYSRMTPDILYVHL
jgi:hypothetical protein